MSISDICITIEGLVKKIAAEKKYNKDQFYKIHTTLSELMAHGTKFKDKSLIGKIILKMPKDDFCEITDVQDCEVGKYNSCVCTKIIVFGGDEINGKACERFTTRAISRKCIDGNLELVQNSECIASSKTGSCDTILIDKDQKIRELQETVNALMKENAVLAGELQEIYEILF